MQLQLRLVLVADPVPELPCHAKLSAVTAATRDVLGLAASCRHATQESALTGYEYN
jgi:hypothetical protein